jgi:hypothetical protein
MNRGRPHRGHQALIQPVQVTGVQQPLMNRSLAGSRRLPTMLNCARHASERVEVERGLQGTLRIAGAILCVTCRHPA